MRISHLILVFMLVFMASGCFIIIEDDEDPDAASDAAVNDAGTDARDTVDSLDTADATEATADAADATDTADTAPDSADAGLCGDPTTRAPIVGVDLSGAIFVGRPALPAADRPTSATEVRSASDYRRYFSFDADSTGLADGSVQGGSFIPSGNNALAWSVQMFFANGGARATIVPTANDVPSADDLARAGELDGGLLVVPGLASAGEQARRDGLGRIEVALNEPDNDDLFFIGNPPAAASTDDLSATNPPPYVSFHDDRAALYVPWLEVTSAVDTSTTTSIPPAGAVAGIYARTNVVRGIWKSPAGLGAGIRGIQGLGQPIADSELDTWNQAQINPMRLLEGEAVVWGARTRQLNNPDWTLVATRRLAMYIEKSIRQGTSWAAFEANDQTLWSRLEASADNFLNGIWRAGGLQGATVDDAYFVRVDHTTTTPDDIDDGIAVIQLGFAALRPAEFIVLRIEVPAGVCL